MVLRPGEGWETIERLQLATESGHGDVTFLSLLRYGGWSLAQAKHLNQGNQ